MFDRTLLDVNDMVLTLQAKSLKVERYQMTGQRGPARSTFAFVMHPESTPILEACRAAEELRTVGITVGQVVANFVTDHAAVYAVTPRRAGDRTALRGAGGASAAAGARSEGCPDVDRVGTTSVWGPVNHCPTTISEVNYG